MDVLIRIEEQHDVVAVRVVHERAFGRPEEARLVEMLHRGEFVRLSLVAEVGGQVVGHVLFSDLPVRTDEGVVHLLALAPLAVLPEWQRRGVGSALVRHGLKACAECGQRAVVVLGEPAYYGRFGFTAEQTARLESPYAGPYFQAVELQPGALESVTGAVQYPAPFTEV